MPVVRSIAATRNVREPAVTEPCNSFPSAAAPGSTPIGTGWVCWRVTARRNVASLGTTYRPVHPSKRAPIREVVNSFPKARQVYRIRRQTYDLLGHRIAKEIVHGVTNLSPAGHASATPGPQSWALSDRIQSPGS